MLIKRKAKQKKFVSEALFVFWWGGGGGVELV